jgi:pimeloyl-ACP methyl ester carboxylesterase
MEDMSSAASRSIVGNLVPVDVGGRRLGVHVRLDGPPDAPPLLLLHGFSGSLHWLEPAVAQLAERFRVVRLDLLGHGATGGGPADAPRQAAMVEAVLAALRITDATVVGHSFGADVAAELAVASDRIARLAIVMQAPDYSDATLPRIAGLINVPVVRTVLPPLLKGLAVAIGPALVAWRVPAGERELARQGLRDFSALDRRMFRVILVERRQRMLRRPLDAVVRAAAKPTLVVLGGKDHFYGTRSARRYADAGARVEIMSESGHSPFVEDPAGIGDLLTSFVAQGIGAMAV